MNNLINWFKFNSLLIIQTLGALAALGISIYFGFYYENKSKLTYEVLSNSSVFSVQENINQLSITYADKQIDQNVEEISLLTIRLRNNGNRDINTNDYYNNSDFGLKLKNASIIEAPELLAYSKDFYRENLNIKYSGDKVVLSQLPLNEGDFYTIKILVINQSGNEATILPMGNISNGVTVVDKIYKNENSESSKINKEVVISFFGIICSLLIFMYLLGFFRKWKTRQRRIKIINGYLGTIETFSDNTRWLLMQYMEERTINFIKVRFILENPEILYSIFEVLEKSDKINNYLNSNYPELKDYKTYLMYGENLKFIKRLIEDGAIKIDFEEDIVTFNKEFKDEFDSFTDFLIKNEYFDLVDELKELSKNNKNKLLT